MSEGIVIYKQTYQFKSECQKVKSLSTMSNVLGGNKTKKSKNTTGSLDQYIQKDMNITSNSNKCQSNVLSPPEEDKLKAKKRGYNEVT